MLSSLAQVVSWQFLATVITELKITCDGCSAIGAELVIHVIILLLMIGPRITKMLVQRIGFLIFIGNIEGRVSVLTGGVLEIVDRHTDGNASPQNTKKRKDSTCLGCEYSP